MDQTRVYYDGNIEINRDGYIYTYKLQDVKNETGDIVFSGWLNSSYPTGKYGDTNPEERYSDVVKEFGEPDYVDKSSEGLAIWNCETLKSGGHPWFRIEIHDEQVPHLAPAPHVDFLYTWYRLDVPVDKMDSVRNISDSVTYDPLKKMIRARCHFHGANVATLWLALQIVKTDMEVTAEDYKKAIMSTMVGSDMYDEKAYDKYVSELTEFGMPEDDERCSRLS